MTELDSNIIFGNKTDVGQVRQNNEDYMESFLSFFGQVFIICDGMGGHIGGEFASRLAVAEIKNVIISNQNNLSQASAIIEEAINHANRVITARSMEEPELKGMGTTCVILIIKNNEANYGHVGDSRLYLVRAGKINLMTKDHSFVQNLVDQGLLTWKEADNHPRKNEIMQALGIFNKINPEVNHKPLKLYKDDIFVLCSDGLSGMVPENVILETILNNSPVHACDKLVIAANQNGGNDNITVQVIKVEKGAELPESERDTPPEGTILKIDKPSVRKARTETINDGYPPPYKKTRKTSKALVAVIILLVCSGVTFIFINPFANRVEPTGPPKQDSAKVKDSISINSDLAYRKIDDFISNVYVGKDASIRSFLAHIRFDTVDYTTKKGERLKWGKMQFLDNIQNFDLRYNGVSQKNPYEFRVLNGKDKTKDVYRVNYKVMGDSLLVEGIEWRKTESEKVASKDKSRDQKVKPSTRGIDKREPGDSPNKDIQEPSNQKNEEKEEKPKEEK